MIHVSDWLTHVDNKEDLEYLKGHKLPDVCLRLLRCNEHYWELVHNACAHIERHCLEKLDGYKLPHGTSGANLGIPWNIIGIAINRGREDASCQIMLNPKLCTHGGDETLTTTNCGSIRLAEPIHVKRWNHIVVEWYDLDGKRHLTDHWPDSHSFTIQHEIDHNLGILITDRQVT